MALTEARTGILKELGGYWNYESEIVDEYILNSLESGKSRYGGIIATEVSREIDVGWAEAMGEVWHLLNLELLDMSTGGNIRKVSHDTLSGQAAEKSRVYQERLLAAYDSLVVEGNVEVDSLALVGREAEIDYPDKGYLYLGQEMAFVTLTYLKDQDIMTSRLDTGEDGERVRRMLYSRVQPITTSEK